MKEKVFPIMDERGGKLPPVPLRVVVLHEATALKNHHQPLLQLNARGGLTPKEMLHVLLDVRWDNSSVPSKRIQNMTQGEAEREMRELVRSQYRMLIQVDGLCDHPKELPKDVSHGVRKCHKCGMLVAFVDDT